VLPKTVNIKFYDIPVNEFAYFVFDEIRRESVVMDHDFVISEERITARLVNVDSAALYSHLKRVLKMVFTIYLKIIKRIRTRISSFTCQSIAQRLISATLQGVS
jgi:hypothetical protein